MAKCPEPLGPGYRLVIGMSMSEGGVPGLVAKPSRGDRVPPICLI
jgi:hypothetical protein